MYKTEWIRLLLILLFCLGTALPAAAQLPSPETAEAVAEEEDDGAPVPEEAPLTTREQAEITLFEEWRDTLMYGIDANVIELLSTLRERRETGLNEELKERFQFSSSGDLRVKVLDFFREFEDPSLEHDALDILLYFYDYSNSLIRASIQYLGAIELQEREEAAELMYELIQEDNVAYSGFAVRALANFGTESDAEFLLDVLENQPMLTDNLRESILLALGDMRQPVAVDTLIEILEDDTNPAVHRQFAADSLGKIGDPRALPALRNALSSDENLLRAYAVSALSQFPDEDNTRMLQRALRDSYARTREVALDGVAAARFTDALPAVRYMARSDPQASIRRKALRTLAELGTDDSWEFIHEHVVRSTTPQDMRILMIQLLIEHNAVGSREVLMEIMRDEWEKDNSRILDALARAMSTTDDPALEDFYLRMLDHPNFVIQMYGVRGISRNSLRRHRERIEQYTGDGYHPALRREAASGLEQL
ncbi:HEAT repeat domain-containing protein [Spirochaeta africana]|uniref:PBS lyase HEAT-like repeat protein n=1 Tax=Spirochaeta africana (strain ATCC 700263 / DSM 8902 / Z-7692) TaxID=889378 RepID=H9UJ95_SPIAZ|nr:HEAT repeat domain-containing protein [Spirochaeta africana]AFG37588.1 PBS lyase HEAT-like repeat protein [Spirochaeta africana DSM 8902]